MTMVGRGKKRTLEVGESVKQKRTKNNKEVQANSKGDKAKAKVHHSSYGCTSGIVLTVGEGDVGQLGLGEDILERTRPAVVNIPELVVQVCAGGMHTVCLTVKGELYTFGCNDEGALGRDTSEEGSENYARKVDLQVKVVQVSAGDSHTAALSDDGFVYAFGNFRDANGSMGLTTAGKISMVPIKVLPDEVVVKISSGSDHLACLTKNGDIYTLGCAEQGQLGRVAGCFSVRGGRKGLDLILSPGLVRCKKYRRRSMVKFSDIFTGQYMTYAIEAGTGDVYGWGLNNYYQLGFDDMENRFIPERVSSFCTGHKWQSLSGGQHHTVALDAEGLVYSLGRGDYGRLGLGESSQEKCEPTLLPTLKDKSCTHIGAGGCVSFAVSKKGDVYAWGMGTSRQLAQAEEDDVCQPIEMKGKQLENRKTVMVDAGGQHTVLLVVDRNGK